jgi:hypothetical protein
MRDEGAVTSPRSSLFRDLEELRARRLLRWHLAVAATGAIFAIRPDLRVQKVTATSLIVQRKGRVRRVRFV